MSSVARIHVNFGEGTITLPELQQSLIRRPVLTLQMHPDKMKSVIKHFKIFVFEKSCRESDVWHCELG